MAEYKILTFKDKMGNEDKEFFKDTTEEHLRGVINLKLKEGWKYICTLTTDVEELYIQQKLEAYILKFKMIQRDIEKLKLDFCKDEVKNTRAFRENMEALNRYSLRMYIRCINIMKHLYWFFGEMPKKEPLDLFNITIRDLS